MNVTIRVRLTKDAEKALAILSGLLKKNKKEVLEGVISESSENLPRRFFVQSANSSSEANASTRRIAALKDRFESNAGVTQSYAISEASKTTLKGISKSLGVKMGVTLSLLLEDQIRALVEAVERHPRAENILKQMAEIKSRIAGDVSSMEKLWYELTSLYPNQEENSPFYNELKYFFDGFHQFTP